MSCFCDCFIFWNGYVRKKDQRYGPSCPKVGGQARPPAQPLPYLHHNAHHSPEVVGTLRKSFVEIHSGLESNIRFSVTAPYIEQ